MATILWRPEVNALTTPQSYKILHVPRSSVGYDEMAADISAGQPIYSAETISSLAPLIMKWIQQQLINGNQVTFPEAFTFGLSFTGKLDSPDSPLPVGDDLLQINVRVSRPFIKEVRHKGKLERMPLSEKLPQISSTEDTKLKLADVLYADGVLHLTGSNLDFDEENSACGCVIKGTRSGTKRQSTYASVSSSSVLLVPDIPAQNDPWNNEYTVSVSTQYSEHGSLRTGTYRRKLRTPLTVPLSGHPHPPETGILTGTAASPLVSIIGGTVTANEMLRIQAVIDSRSGQLLINLLDMQEGGGAGAAVIVTANGELSLPGFIGSAVTSLNIRVNSFVQLKEMLRNDYGGRVVDIMEVKVG
jgi:hypothetical protein